jgi:hypothetical protein
MPLAGFKPAIPATKQPQTYALDRLATGIVFHIHLQGLYSMPFPFLCFEKHKAEIYFKSEPQ